MWTIPGYENQKLFLDNALSNKRFSHAYLFCGPDSSAKLAIAREFGEKILGVENSSRINPDLVVLDEEKLKIEDVRTLISELSLKPFHYQYKVAIITGFENVTDEAANSILKTLEEPNPSTILILLAKNILSVLPTIASRCQTIYFSQELAVDTSNTFLDQLTTGTSAEKLLAIKEYSDQESSALQVVFESWIESEHHKMLTGKAGKYANLQSLLEALQGLKQNLNKKLILEKLFLNLK